MSARLKQKKIETKRPGLDDSPRVQPLPSNTILESCFAL